ncbi:MAG TPA: FMN-binding glutamate synthase family protein [Desulfobacteria bacterium]|nr:FMN-binding glutamate synthase family protein [Desulfobacteria bacterium]
MKYLWSWFWQGLGWTSVLILLLVLIKWKTVSRNLIKRLFGHFMYVLMTDSYGQNLLELYSAVKRSGFLPIMENSLRAEHGTVLKRPFGSTANVPGFKNLLFDVAQLHVLPTEAHVPVDTKVVLGPRARKPITLAIPIMIAGMAYGTSLSAKAKIALARGASMAGTTCNSGEGPFLQAERDNAKYFILQYNRGFWSKNPEILRQADAIEIQFGQGAMAGMSHRLTANKIDETLRQAFPIGPGQDAVIMARHREMSKPRDLISLVQQIRAQVNGIPVGIKIACSRELELDLALALEAGVDFITLGGSQAGTHGSPPSIGNNFGLPTLFGLVRAVNFLEQQGAKKELTLVISGGISEPGEILKALALGADAVGIGTAAVFAISHTQILKALPWEPPTQIIWYDGKYAAQFDENHGAQNLANYLKSSVTEIADGVRILGKTSIKELSRQDLFALDKETAQITGIPLGYVPMPFTPPASGRQTEAASVTKASGTTHLPSRRFNYRPMRKP